MSENPPNWAAPPNHYSQYQQQQQQQQHRSNYAQQPNQQQHMQNPAQQYAPTQHQQPAHAQQQQRPGGNQYSQPHGGAPVQSTSRVPASQQQQQQQSHTSPPTRRQVNSSPANSHISNQVTTSIVAPRAADEEMEDGRIRNREAVTKIRDAWIYKQIRARQDEFTQYKQVSLILTNVSIYLFFY